MKIKNSRDELQWAPDRKIATNIKPLAPIPEVPYSIYIFFGALTGNRASNPSVHGLAPNQLSQPGRGSIQYSYNEFCFCFLRASVLF